MSEQITGQKREWEPGAPPEGPPPESADAAPEAAPEASEPPAEATGSTPPPPPPPPPAPAASNGGGANVAGMQAEIAWLKQQIPMLQHQLAGLQHQHAQLTSHQAQHAHHIPHPAAAAGARPAPAAPQRAAHNPDWSEQLNPENGSTYYWNARTGESTYTRPADYNPPAGGAAASGGAAVPQPSGGGVKGPPGANLFIVRKMRRGEYDEFTDADLYREFGKYGNVTRAEMTVDKDTGWSKGFGFVSFQHPHEADAALQAVHGSWMAGREMKVEYTKEN